MRTRLGLRRRLRSGTALLAVLALIAAVLAPTASAQSRSIGTVVIANGWSSADSAVSSALAALESDSRSDAVVLYSSRRELATSTANFIEDHQPSEVILVGGTAALSSAVQAEVVELIGSAAVRRIEGRDRFDTAAKAVPSTATTFIVANGFSAADTGVAAALAATRTDAAVLLATADSLTEPTERIIREQQPLAVEFVGGTAVLAASLVDRVRELAPSIPAFPRHSGTSRTATAAAAAPNRSTTLVIANGWSPADMGVAAAYAAITTGAAVLYSETDRLTSPTENRIEDLAPREIVLVGGSAALDTSLHARLHELAPGARIRRISGSDRIDTAVRAADGTLTTVGTEAPGAPTSLTTVSRNLSLSVSWRAPAATSSDVDDAITGYVVEYRACTATPRTCTTSPRWTGWITRSHSGTSTSTTITNLTNSTAYEVRVRARNSFGLGAWSAIESGIPLAQTAKPSVPGGLTVEAANRLLQVSWNDSVPPRDGTVDGYDVEFRACTASDTTCATSPSWGNWRPHSHPGTGTTTTITRLDNGTAYQVRVQARSSKGDSGWSPAKSATPALLPGFERAPALTAGDRQIVVQWNEPADSGSAIRDYDVQYRPCTATDSDTTDLTCEPDADADATWGGWRARSHSGTGQVATITGLTNGTAYEVQVRASNATGVGPWSVAEKATPVSVPAKPSTPTVEPGNTQLVVTWTAPSDNGRDITGYDVEYCTGTCASDSEDWDDTRVRISATRHEIRLLTNGMAYKVRVRAVNNLGVGPWSSSRTGTPRALPDAPGLPTLTAGDRKIDVSWDAPGDNGSSITAYGVQYRACTAASNDDTPECERWAGWRTRSHTGTATTTDITSLANGTEYEVRVRARNANGFGPWSVAEDATPLGKPAKPATPKLTAGDGELVVTWSPPADNGSPIAGYKVQRCESTADCTDDANWVPLIPQRLRLTPDETTGSVTHTLSNLTNGTIYRVRVLAVNDEGDGPWSTTVSGTPTVRPGAPANLNVTVANRQVGLSWSAPSGQGVTISGYDIEYRACEATDSVDTVLTCGTGTEQTWGDWKTRAHSGVGISTTITGLTNGTAYQVRVRARNANGPGPWSAEPFASGIPLAAPSPPTGLTVEAAHQELSVSWTESVTNGAEITGYVMQHRACTATPTDCTSNPKWDDWIPPDTDTSNDSTTARKISSLANGTKHQVRVKATSRNSGSSGWSQIKSATPAAVPAAPSAPTLIPDDRQIRVEWTAPEDYDSAIRDYDVEYRACAATDSDTADLTCATEPTWGSWLPHGHSGASRSTVIMGLTNGTSYQVRVRATNANGVGPWLTDPPDATPIGAPAMPTTPMVTPGDTLLEVDWIKPRSDGSEIDSYDVWHQPCLSTNADTEVLTCANNPAWGEWTKLSVSDPQTTRTITGLNNGTAYQIQVRARDGSSEGPWSSPVTSIPMGRPDAPTVMLTSGNQRLIVSWPRPHARGSTITGFKLRYCDNNDANKNCSDYNDWTIRTGIGAGSTSRSITGLTNGKLHLVEMLTTSRSHGDSVWSSQASETTGAPNAPSTPRLTAGSQQIGVTWTAPAQNHSVITAYEVAYCNDTDADCSAVGVGWQTPVFHSDLTDLSETLSSLMPGKTYRVRVRAQNTQGWGAWSSTASATPTT